MKEYLRKEYLRKKYNSKKHFLIRRKKAILSLITIFITMGILSLTIGRELLAGTKPSLFSFGIVHFAGYLFILLMPVEVLVPIYLAQGHQQIAILIIALTTAIVAQFINYAVGYLMSTEIINDLIGKKRYAKAEKHIQSYGGWAVFFFNLFPLASSVLSLVAGMVRFSLKRLILYAFIGLSIKYVIMVYFFGLAFT